MDYQNKVGRKSLGNLRGIVSGSTMPITEEPFGNSLPNTGENSINNEDPYNAI